MTVQQMGQRNREKGRENTGGHKEYAKTAYNIKCVNTKYANTG